MLGNLLAGAALSLALPDAPPDLAFVGLGLVGLADFLFKAFPDP